MKNFLLNQDSFVLVSIAYAALVIIIIAYELFI